MLEGWLVELNRAFSLILIYFSACIIRGWGLEEGLASVEDLYSLSLDKLINI